MNLLREKPNQKYVFWDVETGGLGLLYDNVPWQLGYVITQNGKILEKHEHCIKWENLKMSAAAAKVNRFSWDEYHQKAEDPVKVLDEFEKYLNNSEFICAGHNILNLDIHVLQIWRKTLGRKRDYSFLYRLIDTNAIAKMVKKNIQTVKPEERLMMMFRFNNYVEKGLKTNLTLIGKECGIEFNYETLHQGLNDCCLNALVWEKLKWMIEI